MKPNACHMLAPVPRSEAEIYRSLRSTLRRSHDHREHHRHQDQQRCTNPGRPAPKLILAHKALDLARPCLSQAECLAAHRAGRIASRTAE